MRHYLLPYHPRYHRVWYQLAADRTLAHKRHNFISCDFSAPTSPKKVQCLVICNLARKVGYHAEPAIGYIEATEKLRTSHYNCITLDLSLGDRDGIEVLRFLAISKITAGIVIVSGNDPRILKSTAWVARSLGLNIRSVLIRTACF